MGEDSHLAARSAELQGTLAEIERLRKALRMARFAAKALMDQRDQAEVERDRLQAESLAVFEALQEQGAQVERLREENDRYCKTAARYEADHLFVEEAEAERDEARAEVERLLDALVDIDYAVCHGQPDTAKRLIREAYESTDPTKARHVTAELRKREVKRDG